MILLTSDAKILVVHCVTSTHVGECTRTRKHGRLFAGFRTTHHRVGGLAADHRVLCAGRWTVATTALDVHGSVVQHLDSAIRPEHHDLPQSRRADGTDQGGSQA